MSKNTGIVSQVIGPVVDVTFEKEGSELPNIFDALEIKMPDEQTLVIDGQLYIG